MKSKFQPQFQLAFNEANKKAFQEALIILSLVIVLSLTSIRMFPLANAQTNQPTASQVSSADNIKISTITNEEKFKQTNPSIPLVQLFLVSTDKESHQIINLMMKKDNHLDRKSHKNFKKNAHLLVEFSEIANPQFKKVLFHIIPVDTRKVPSENIGYFIQNKIAFFFTYNNILLTLPTPTQILQLNSIATKTPIEDAPLDMLTVPGIFILNDLFITIKYFGENPSPLVVLSYIFKLGIDLNVWFYEQSKNSTQNDRWI